MSYKVKREISQGPKWTSQIWKSAVCFLLKSVEVRGAGTRDEPLRTSAWKASVSCISLTYCVEYV